MKLRELAELIGGTIIGDGETEITGVAGIEEAAAGDITFLASPKFLKAAKESRAACLIVKEEIEGISRPQLKVSNPYYAFARALEHFHPAPAVQPGVSALASISDRASIAANAAISPFAVISAGAIIGEGTVIYPFVFIGEDSIIGKNCIIHSNVSVRERVKIGDRVIVHAGTVIGSDGFGYVFEKGTHHKIPQVGGVVIGDDVEIGSNVCIDRATTGQTMIGSGTKIDNLVQIGHNVKVGERSILVAQVAIGGSSEIGSFVTLAGQVGVADHAVVEPGTMVAAQSGLAGHIRRGIYAGSPGIPHKTWLRAQSLYGKLPEMSRKLRELEERLLQLEKGKTQ